jgi:serine/threonine-protein phosphatase 2A activator
MQAVQMGFFLSYCYLGKFVPMNPTRAPWAGDATGQQDPSARPASDVLPTASRQGVHTGTPVRPLIDAEPCLPSVRPETWPDTWEPASKRIRTQQDVQLALKRSSLRKFVAFSISLSEAVVGMTLSEECPLSPNGHAVIAALDRLSQICKDTPTATHAVRYGNPAFRAWFDSMQAVAPELVYSILGDDLGPATIELVPYFLDSFGNRSRIDYGTGHETTFMMFLYCLFSLGVLQESDRKATVTRIFKKYIDLMRQLQTKYWCACLLPLYSA